MNLYESLLQNNMDLFLVQALHFLTCHQSEELYRFSKDMAVRAPNHDSVREEREK